jgi:hypothetical protein
MDVSLFGRAYTVVLSADKATVGTSFGNMAAGQGALRVAFEVKKDVSQTPNTAKITLFNLQPQLRSALTKGWRVKLQAGYVGLVDQVFIGTVTTAKTQRQGPDITTEIEATDGGESLLNASFNQKYPSQTPLWQILQDIARAMDVQPGVVLGLPDYRISRAQTLCGGCAQVLHTCLDKHGLVFSVQNGKLNITPKGKHIGQAAIVISQSAGMLGVPSVTGDALRFEALLNPRLVPGQMVVVQSKNPQAAGYYSIEKAELSGDSRDAKWQIACECARLTQPVQQLSAAHGFQFNTAVEGLR